MTNLQKIKDKNTESHLSRAVRDLVLLIAIAILTLILSYFFNLFSLIVKFLQKYPDKIIYVDEVITTLLILSIGLAVFAWRRWLELRKETAERIKKQEELLRITATQADTERIISKQLHIDMDQMKQDVQEILHFFLNKQKKTV
ncbi:MAG: hypothetical protein PHY56_06550 [Candidatus Omnitrophica bacterium]|jgi:uncharacterized membrane protein (DUF106 family)|nr:hypothetical protein [Candidatus Omnitrophota bacterium]